MIRCGAIAAWKPMKETYGAACPPANAVWSRAVAWTATSGQRVPVSVCTVVTKSSAARLTQPARRGAVTD
ncbi:hypothetical protein [Azospirillum largimobile]